MTEKKKVLVKAYYEGNEVGQAELTVEDFNSLTDGVTIIQRNLDFFDTKFYFVHDLNGKEEATMLNSKQLGEMFVVDKVIQVYEDDNQGYVSKIEGNFPLMQIQETAKYYLKRDK